MTLILTEQRHSQTLRKTKLQEDTVVNPASMVADTEQEEAMEVEEVMVVKVAMAIKADMVTKGAMVTQTEMGTEDMKVDLAETEDKAEEEDNKLMKEQYLLVISALTKKKERLKISLNMRDSVHLELDYSWIKMEDQRELPLLSSIVKLMLKKHAD